MLDALGADGGPLAQAAEASEQLQEASRAVQEAEHELTLYVQTDLISVVGQETFRQGIEARQRQIDQARARQAELQTQAALADELTSGTLLVAWPELSIQEKRTLLHGFLERVVVTRADGRGKHTRPSRTAPRSCSAAVSPSRRHDPRKARVREAATPDQGEPCTSSAHRPLSAATQPGVGRSTTPPHSDQDHADIRPR